MKIKGFFKKTSVILLVFCLMASLAVVAVGAAGVDDGTLSVVEKNSKKYFGTEKSDFCTEYISADGDESSFYRYENIDINGDAKTSVADLVALTLAIKAKNDGTDLNFDSSVNADDLAILRNVILGETDVEIK